ncbi:MAG: metallophosphoesterase [Fimbriiglobus sp.]|jgi:predicted phosphodiesterase|nr:metallophosphoesterase [Fimbriiglobus sp.]
MKRVLLAAGVLAILAAAVVVSQAVPTQGDAKPADATAGIIATSEDKNPWTGLKANADPDSFQFAVVSDRTGGNRGKIFTRAVERLNLLQPEFVLSVGDLIQGYSTKQEQIEAEWKEFNGITAKFEMPFFYVPGNHDLTNSVQNDDWKARFGRKFYHFVYKGVLFFAVNSEDEDANEPDEKKKYKASYVSAKQTEYFKKVLEETKGIRWVNVFLHKPLWTASDLEKNGWAAFEKVLEGRQYSVFCGHVHRFQKFTRNGMNYYQLATTGGGSRLRGVEYGEFDHITWITMKKGGPIISHVMLDGILPEDTIQKDNNEPGVVVRNPPKPVPASGQLLMDGKPLAGVTVGFFRKVAATDTAPARTQYVADALTNSEGKFTPSTLKAFDGLPEGDFAVTLFQTENGKYYSGETKEKNLLPEKYADAKVSPLKVTFKAGESILIQLAKE